MKKTKQNKIDSNSKWAKENKSKVRIYKQKYKNKQKKLARDYIFSLKASAGCCICKNKNPYCLDFHHKNPENKKNTICNLVRHGYSFDIIKNEIEKCEIICSNCHRTQHYTGKYIRNKKGALIQNIKSKSKCSVCSFNKLECLDFHHIENKNDNIGAMVRDKYISIEQLEHEIQKCIILCSNCHRILHASDTETIH